MLGPATLRLLDQPIGRSIEELVPQDHFYRFLDATLDLTFVRTWVQDLYAERGRPSIDPVVFFRLQLVMFLEGIRSERKLMETVALNIAHRWYLGYNLDEPLPDYSSLTRIRERLGLPIFTRFFEHVVELCQAAGLAWGKELLFDGTKVRANAGINSLSGRWTVATRRYLETLFAGTANGTPPWDVPLADAEPAAQTEVLPERAPADQTDAEHRETDPPPRALAALSLPAEDAQPSAPSLNPDAPTPLPFAGTAEAEQELAAANHRVWRLLDERRADPTRPSSSRGYTAPATRW